MRQSLKNAITALVAFLARFLLSATFIQSLLASVSAWLLLWYFEDEESKRLPPGPIQFPWIGNLEFFFYKDINEFKSSVHKKYGPIVHLKIGSLSIFSVSDYEMVKELSLHPGLQLRPNQAIFVQMNKGLGVITSEGDLWKHQRRFVLHSLRDFGMGRLGMQEKIHNELNKVFGVMDKANGRPIRLKQLLEKSTANVIFALAFNKQFDYDDENFMTRITAMEENVRLTLKIAILEILPFTKSSTGASRQHLLNNVEVMKEQSQEFIDDHRSTLDPNNPRDLLDLYLMEMDKNAEGKNGDEEYNATFFVEQLKYLITDLFLAGAETSSTTIGWALLYMVHNPEIQQKVQKEIDEVVGTERSPLMEDRLNLPYTTATLQEVERLGSVVAAGISRSNGSALKYRDYVIPKRSVLQFSLYSVHRDPKLWEDPLKFSPSRFVDSNGKVFRPPYLLPFGSGKRSCVGEALAKMEIFLYFATLMQNFLFEAPDKDNLPSMKTPQGFVRGPTDYLIKCTRRET